MKYSRNYAKLYRQRKGFGRLISPREEYLVEIKSQIIVATTFMVCSLAFLFHVSACEGAVDTSKAVIHHTASHDVSIEEVRRWHVDGNGWSDVGYNFLIRKNGNIEKGRPLDRNGAHAKGRNHYLGIALTGYNVFTQEQIESLISLLIELEVHHIEPHHENCPGLGLDIDMIRLRLKKERIKWNANLAINY